MLTARLISVLAVCPASSCQRTGRKQQGRPGADAIPVCHVMAS
jgi:hypothetical protein